MTRSSGSGWLGRLQLSFERALEGTRLVGSAHEGPLRIQRVLQPEGPEWPHVYLLHPPGGVVGGDRLETRVSLGTGASVLLTTPAAQKLYRSAGEVAHISNELAVRAGAKLEWLPGETLAFSRARVTASTRVHLDDGAAFLGWEINSFGMPASGQRFDEGWVATRFELFRQGRPMLIESLDLRPSAGMLEAAFALRGQTVVANLYAVPAVGSISSSLLDSVREAIAQPPAGLFSATSLDELLVVRALAPSVEGVRGVFVKIWQLLRPAVLERAALIPRVWST